MGQLGSLLIGPEAVAGGCRLAAASLVFTSRVTPTIGARCGRPSNRLKAAFAGDISVTDEDGEEARAVTWAARRTEVRPLSLA